MVQLIFIFEDGIVLVFNAVAPFLTINFQTNHCTFGNCGCFRRRRADIVAHEYETLIG